VPKQHYYVLSPLGRRLISLGLGKVALSFVGVNGTEERRGFDEVAATSPDYWRSEWLRFRGLEKWAAYLEEMEASSCVNV